MGSPNGGGIGPLVAALLQPATRWVNAQRTESTSGGSFFADDYRANAAA